ncbi:MAG: ATP-binding protein [Actinomycetales bacterium]|nr:ATP-binding protein [Actinomycetales bacterium]
MEAPPRSALVNAFLPSQEIDDPDRFVGRRPQVEELTDVLRVSGSVPLIFGPRGLGKSSLAHQMRRIAEGDTTLLDRLGLADRSITGDEAFVSVGVSCSRTTGTTEALLHSIITAIESDLADHLPEPSRSSTERTSSTTIQTPFLKQQWSSKHVDAPPMDGSRGDPEVHLDALCSEIATRSGRRVLVVVDELDLLTDTTGLSSLIKNRSSSYLKFLLVGIADGYHELLADHESIARQLAPTAVPPMSDAELEAIIDRAEYVLRSSGLEVTFHARARSRVIRVARGFPWFVHLLGQSALKRAFDSGRAEVAGSDVSYSIRHLHSERLSERYADSYRHAIGESREREIVLRLAAWSPETTVASPLIEQMANALGIDDARALIRQLHQTGFGAPLREVRQGAFFRFSDEIFRIYARTCPPIYPNVQKRVDAAYELADEGQPRKRGRHSA